MTSAVRLPIRQIFLVLGMVLTSLMLVSTGAAQAPLPSNPQVDSGVHPFGTYDGVHDLVSVGSGNLSFCIPLVSLPGLIRHDLNIPLCYNSQFEQPSGTAQSIGAVPVVSWFPWVWGSNTPVMGPGWTLTGRVGVYTAPNSGQVIFMPDGGTYTLPATQSNGEPLNSGPDWSGGNLYINASQTWIYQKNGTRSTASVSTTTQEYDSYGSLITFTPTSVTDTLGRTVAVSASAASGGTPAHMAFQYPDSNGVMRTVNVQFITNTNTCGGGQSPTTPYGTGGTYSLPSAIILPDGLTYTFQYDACGNLNKVTYPSGGYTRYAYALETVGEWGIGYGTDTGDWHPYQQNEVVAKYVCPAPSVALGATTAAAGNTCSVPEETTTYAPTETFPNTGNSGNTVTDPMGNYVVYQFTQANVPWFVPSLESSRIYYNSAGRALKSVQTTYNCICSNTPMPTLPQTQTTAFTNGSGSQIKWTYDLRPLNIADSPLLEKQEYDFGPSGSESLLRTTKYDWLQLDNPTTYGWPTGSTGAHILDRMTSKTVYNASGSQVAQTTYQYDYGNPVGWDLGFLTQVSRWNNGGSPLVTSNVWGAAGGITQTTDPKGNITRYSYTDNYADGINRNSGAYPTTITYANGTHEYRQYYWGSGLVAASCGQNFVGTCKTGLNSVADYASYAYDLMGRKVSTITGDGGSTTTCFSEISGGSCSTGSYPLEVTSIEAISAGGVQKKSTEVLDGEGKVTQTQLNTDPSCNGTSYVKTTYDSDERVSTKSNPFCSTGDPTYGVTTYTYDGLSRITQVTNPDGTSTASTYTGRAVLNADEGNGTVNVERISQTDGLGRLTFVCEVSSTTQQGTSSNTPSSCGLDVSGTGFLTSYSYDPLGNLLSVAQGGESRSFNYDSLSRLKTATNPESGTTTYGYDNDGNLTNKASALGITTTYTYDVLNRLTGKSYSDGSTPSACFQYDQGTNGIGRLGTEWTQAGTCPASPSGSVLTERKFAAYDLMGRVATDEQCSLPGNCTGTPNTVNYGYDLAGDVTSFTNGLTGASAMAFSNVYDMAGRLSTVTGPQVAGGSYEPLNLFTAVAYNAAGTIKDAEIGTGISLHRDYNSRLLPTDEIDAVKTTPGMASVQITGGEQIIAYSTGSITFGGSEGSTVVNGQTEYDGGTFLVFINGGQPYQISYGQNDTAQTLASKLAADISCTYASVQAVAVGATVYLTSCSAGASTNYPLTVELAGNSSYFPKASFQIMASGATMTQARPVTDSPNEPMSMIEFSGTEQNNDTGTFTIAFYNASTGAFAGVVGVSWNYQSSPQSLAAALLTSLPACSAGGLISASQNNSVVTLTSCTPGTSYVENIQLDYGGSGTASFSAEADAFLVTNAGTYDSGTVTLAINGTNVASTPYGSNSTPASIVSGLISSNGSSSPVTLTPSAGNASFLTITAKGGNTDEGYTYALSFAYNSTAFTQPSFSASSTSGTLVGGENAPLYSWAINGYAPDGNVLSMTDSVMGAWSYTYDDMNRLVSGSASAGSMSGLNLGWNYDRYGNRWDQNASGNGSAVQAHFTFSGNNNRIDQYSSNYDADGNLKGDGVHTYTYDAENRIIALNGQPTYVYDAEGMRVAKLGSGGAVSAVYILGAGGQQITELNASGQWAHSNVYGAYGLLSTYTPSTNSYHYNLTDWLGTKRMQTYASGNMEETCISYPFGDGLSCIGGADATEKHYTAKERDAESGLDYFGARYLSSGFGRFMTPDWAAAPMAVPYARFGTPQSLNLYAYAGNAPDDGVDFNGHFIGMENGVEEDQNEAAASAAQQADSAASSLAAQADNTVYIEDELIPGVGLMTRYGLISWRELFGPNTRPKPGISNQVDGLWDFPWANPSYEGILADEMVNDETIYASEVDSIFVNGIPGSGSGLATPPSAQFKATIRSTMEPSPYVSGPPSIITDFSAAKTLTPNASDLQPGASNSPANPNNQKRPIPPCQKNLSRPC